MCKSVESVVSNIYHLHQFIHLIAWMTKRTKQTRFFLKKNHIFNFPQSFKPLCGTDCHILQHSTSQSMFYDIHKAQTCRELPMFQSFYWWFSHQAHQHKRRTQLKLGEKKKTLPVQLMVEACKRETINGKSYSQQWKENWLGEVFKPINFFFFIFLN